MPSIMSTAAFLATALFTMSVNSQATYYIDPNTVPLATRQSWCESQTTACPLLCLQLPGASSTTAANNCDATTLTYDCVCGNGLSPNASEYSQTLPYFLCTEYGTQCVAGCNGDINCQSACRADHPCGAQNPIRVNVTTTSSTSASASTTLPAGASSGTAGIVYTGIGGAAATSTSSSSSSTTKSSAQHALDLGRSYGLLVIFTGLFAGFALVM